VVRFEIPPMMRYCAGTCPCTWVTAVALPNLAHLRQSLGINGFSKADDEVRNVRFSVLTGERREEEIKFLDYLIPAQSMMGLSSYFAWYYGYGFYGPAKYPLLLYGLTLACHSVAQERDIASNPNYVLAHRAACAVGTFLCSCCFLRLSKLASLLMLPACGVYACLTNLTMQGIKSGDANMNAVENENNNQDLNNQNKIITQRTEEALQQNIHRPSDSRIATQRRRRKRRESILRVEDISTSSALTQQRNGREPVKPYVSFNNTVGVKYRNASSTSLSSTSLQSSLDNMDIVK